MPDTEKFSPPGNTKIDTVRRCPASDCGKPLQRRIGESPAQFASRKHCNHACHDAARRLPEEHGSVTGINQHRKGKTRLCDACRAVQRENYRAYRRGYPTSANRERARNRALKALIKLHRADYLRLCYVEYEKAGVS